MNSLKARLVALAALGAASLSMAGMAQAQYAPPPPYAPPPGYPPPRYAPSYGPPPAPPRSVYRNGLVFGVGVGAGAITANDCASCGGGALGLELHLGGMIQPRAAIMAEAWGLWREVGDGTNLTNSLFLAAMQYWLTDQLWLKGGLGGGTIYLSDSYSGATFTSESAFAVEGAAGFEVVQWFNFALDLQFRLARAFYSGGGANNIAFLVGFNWY